MQRLVNMGHAQNGATKNMWSAIDIGTHFEVVMTEMDRQERLCGSNVIFNKSKLIHLIRNTTHLDISKSNILYNELIHDGLIWDNGDTLGWINVVGYRRHDDLMTKSEGTINKRIIIPHQVAVYSEVDAHCLLSL
jgi:hypothetical protein